MTVQSPWPTPDPTSLENGLAWNDARIEANKQATGITDVVGGAVSSVTSGITNPVSNINDLVKKISEPGFWKRILVGLAGVWLIYIGVIIIIASTPLGKSVTGAAITGASRGVVSGGAVVDAVDNKEKD